MPTIFLALNIYERAKFHAHALLFNKLGPRCSQVVSNLCILSTHVMSIYLWGGRVVRSCWVNFQYRSVLRSWIHVGQGPTALAVGAGGGC